MASNSYQASRPRTEDLPGPRTLRIEHLEDRRLLAARAIDAVNLFALDVYEQMQREEGNLFYSPLSISTGLAMATVGAVGQTAAEMEQVLHLGSEPGIDASFNALFTSLEANQFPVVPKLELQVANAMWPQTGLPLEQDFVDTIESDYRGYAQSLNYANPAQAEDTINSWVAQQTRGRIQDLVSDLSSNTKMVLTNTVYFNGQWDQPFIPRLTENSGFTTDDGQTVSTPIMYTQVQAHKAVIHGFQVLDLSFSNNRASMILMLPPQENASDHVSTELLTEINDWVETPRQLGFIDVSLPKFQTTVSTSLSQLLVGLGMPTAFSDSADFSEMTEASVFIEKVFHKAFLNINEQGTEAAAATEIDFLICFAAGTPILTPDGQKPIEEVKPGDFVLARIENNVEGDVEPRLVEEVFQNHTNILEIHVGGQTIRTTESHPFFVRGKGWTEAAQLQPKDRLATFLFYWFFF